MENRNECDCRRPWEWIESITMLRLPEHADKRLQELMDRNNEGQLADEERADLTALAELCDRLRDDSAPEVAAKVRLW